MLPKEQNYFSALKTCDFLSEWRCWPFSPALHQANANNKWLLYISGALHSDLRKTCTPALPATRQHPSGTRATVAKAFGLPCKGSRWRRPSTSLLLGLWGPLHCMPQGQERSRNLFTCVSSAYCADFRPKGDQQSGALGWIVKSECKKVFQREEHHRNP